MRAAPLVLLLLLAPAAAASPLVEVGDVPVEVKGAPMTFVTVEVPVRSVASEAVVVTLGVADLPKYDDSVVVVPEQLRLDPGESEPVMVTFLTPHHDGYVNRTDYYVLQVRARPLAQPDAEPELYEFSVALRTEGHFIPGPWALAPLALAATAFARRRR